MPYKLRSHTCPGCGVTHLRRGPAVPAMRCKPCGIETSAEQQRQMHAHEGPWWDTWTMQLFRAARALARDDRPVRARRAS